MILNIVKLDRLRDNYRRMRGIAALFAVLMVLCGIVTFCVPKFTPWMMILGILFYSLFYCILYCGMSEDYRDGWNLASGIIWAVIAFLQSINTISASTAAVLVSWGSMDRVIAILVGCASIHVGIKLLCSSDGFKAMNNNPFGCDLGGILAVLAGFLILTCPIGSLLPLTVASGLFLTLSGLSLFFLSRSF